MNSESLRLRARAIHCDSVSDSRENAITTATIHSVYEVGSRNYAWPRILLMTKPVLLLCLLDWQIDPPWSPSVYRFRRQQPSPPAVLPRIAKWKPGERRYAALKLSEQC